MAEEIKRIAIDEFRSLGYLQEINRRFLHPLGLALEIVEEEDGTMHLGGVWDYRDAPEGITFDSLDAVSIARALAIDAMWKQREGSRREALGYMVQPLP